MQHKEEQKYSPYSRRSSTSQGRSDTSFDFVREKSELLSRLDEMKKAIDVYRENKSKGICLQLKITPEEPLSLQVDSMKEEESFGQINSEVLLKPYQRKQAENFQSQKTLQSMGDQLTQYQSKARLDELSPCSERENSGEFTCNFNQESTIGRVMEAQCDFIPVSQANQTLGQDGNMVSTLQKYLQDSCYIESKAKQSDEKEVQCQILSLEEQASLIQKNKEQLSLFEEQLNLVKEQLQRQQELDEGLGKELEAALSEVALAKQQKGLQDKREEDLLRQIEELVQVIEDQTRELKERDQRILEQQDEESKRGPIQEELNKQMELNVQLTEKQEQDSKLIEELQGKLAEEFNKKRLLKQGYEDQFIEMSDQMKFYREKYEEMKELLDSCREQLREFEELNGMRNDVIERLEHENKVLKEQGMMKRSPEFNTAPHTPSKVYDKSFSLHLQQVQCEQSLAQNRTIDYPCPPTAKKPSLDSSTPQKAHFRESSEKFFGGRAAPIFGGTKVSSVMATPKVTSEQFEYRSYGGRLARNDLMMMNTVERTHSRLHDSILQVPEPSYISHAPDASSQKQYCGDQSQLFEEQDSLQSTSSITQYDQLINQRKTSSSQSEFQHRNQLRPKMMSNAGAPFLSPEVTNRNQNSFSKEEHEVRSTFGYSQAEASMNFGCLKEPPVFASFQHQWNKENKGFCKSRQPECLSEKPHQSESKYYHKNSQCMERNQNLPKPYRVLSNENRPAASFSELDPNAQRGSSHIQVLSQYTSDQHKGIYREAVLGNAPCLESIKTQKQIFNYDYVMNQQMAAPFGTYQKEHSDLENTTDQTSVNSANVSQGGHHTSNKMSIRDEIKKLHQNINSLRSKMNLQIK